jgi:hypothetical protein
MARIHQGEAKKHAEAAAMLHQGGQAAPGGCAPARGKLALVGQRMPIAAVIIRFASPARWAKPGSGLSASLPPARRADFAGSAGEESSRYERARVAYDYPL